MRSSAVTVEEYLSELPDERRIALEAVRQVILDNLPEGYEEVMNWGMISYQVPLEIWWCSEIITNRYIKCKGKKQ